MLRAPDRRPRPTRTPCRSPPPCRAPPSRRRSAGPAERPAARGSMRATDLRQVARHLPSGRRRGSRLVLEHAEHLLDEERLPPAASTMRAGIGRRQRGRPREVADQVADSPPRSGRQGQRACGGRGPTQPGRRSSRSGRARHRTRITARPGSSRRGTRPGPGTSARPSGCRRTATTTGRSACRLSRNRRIAQKDLLHPRGRLRRDPTTGQQSVRR